MCKVEARFVPSWLYVRRRRAFLQRLTYLAARQVFPAMPRLLSFSAGAILCEVVDELIPEISSGEHSNIGVVFFTVSLSLIMVLDTVLG